MHQITPYGSTTPSPFRLGPSLPTAASAACRMLTWKSLRRSNNRLTPVFTYAAFADDNGCSALTFGGGGTTDSYDSSTVTYSGGNVVTQSYGGNVGTNGNLSTNGNPTTINGNLSTPRTGVGRCSSNNVTAWTVRAVTSRAPHRAAPTRQLSDSGDPGTRHRRPRPPIQAAPQARTQLLAAAPCPAASSSTPLATEERSACAISYDG